MISRALANHAKRLPQPGTVIASSRTSPLDALYLAAIFDPVFTTSYPSTRLVQPVSLWTALLNSFSGPEARPPPNAKLMDLPAVIAANPHRAVVVFPECTTTNGRGILKFAPSLVTVSPTTRIFPISLRYAAADITTPVPGSYTTFIWNLLSTPTHVIRVRIAESVSRASTSAGIDSPASLSYGTLESSQEGNTLQTQDEAGSVSTADKRLLDKTGEALARLGRVKRVGLGVKEKTDFVRAWTRQRRR
jgi:1-acylglycerol-3-phosphate O-acyltransferase